MVIKVYVSLISCSQEIKKNQQRTMMILESKGIAYVAIDITDPSQEEAKDWVVSSATPKPDCKIPVTPQIYNEAQYCGDFDQLDMANECDMLGEFLKMTGEERAGIKLGITSVLPEKERLQQEELYGVTAEDQTAADPQEAAQLETEGGDPDHATTVFSEESQGAGEDVFAQNADHDVFAQNAEDVSAQNADEDFFAQNNDLQEGDNTAEGVVDGANTEDQTFEGVEDSQGVEEDETYAMKAAEGPVDEE